MADPATKEMVDSWSDNTEYTVKMRVKTGAGKNRHIAQVVGPVETEESESEEMESETETETPEAPPGPAAVKKAMGSSGMKPMM